jgi:phenylalanine-4-hydroxylase
MSLHLLARPHHPAAPASGMVWKMLFDRQQALLHRWVSPAFGRALVELGLRRDTLPSLGQVAQVVRQRTGWVLLPTSQPLSEAAYYAALARRELPVGSRLRSFSEFDQPPGGPDLFADLFGRVPLLLEPGYADALHALGQAWELAGTPAAVALLRRFTRAAFERGLLASSGGRPHFYGVALLTSARHLHAAAAADAATYAPLASAVQRLSQPVPAETDLTAVGPPVYYVAESWADLSAAVQQLRQELLKMQRQALASQALPFAAVPTEPNGRGRAFAARIPGLWRAR